MSTEHIWDEIRRRLPLLLSIVVVLGTFYVFSTVGDEEKRLTIAVKQGVESLALKEIAQKFSREKHVAVEIVELPYDELYAEEQRQLVERPSRKRDSVAPFDVIMVDDPWLYALVSDPHHPNDPKRRRLRNLNDVLKAKDNDFFPSTLSVSTYCPSPKECSDYYAIPFVANSQLFAYRAKDFEKSQVPTTWKQVVDASKRVEQRNDIGYVTRIGPGNSIVTDFLPILWAYDPGSLPKFPNGKEALLKPEAAFSTLQTLVAARKNLGGASFDDFDVSSYLQKQRASMGIVWSAWAMMLVDIDDGRSQAAPATTVTITMPDCVAQLTALSQSGAGAENSIKEKLIFGNVPRGPGSGLGKGLASPDSQPELGVWLLAIPAGTKQQVRDPVQEDLAVEFIKYATDLDDDAGAKQRKVSLLAAQRGTPPPRVCVLAELQQDPKFKERHPSLIPAIAWSLTNGRARPRTACWKEIESRLGSHLERLIDQGGEPADTKKSANQTLAPLFDEEECRAFLNSVDAK